MPFLTSIFGGKLTATTMMLVQEGSAILKQRLRRAVNDAPLSAEQQEGLLSEHCEVFRLNHAIVRGFSVGWLDLARANMKWVALLASAGALLVLLARWLYSSVMK